MRKESFNPGKCLSEKGGSSFEGVKLLLCENPLPPIEEAISAANQEVPHSNFYTEAYSAPLRKLISERIHVPTQHIHINAGSEIILRQLFLRFGQRVHLLTPTYPLFIEISQTYTETRLEPSEGFRYDLSGLNIPERTTLVVIVNPNNPNGSTFNMASLPDLLTRHKDKLFLVDEAFIGVAGETVAHLVPKYSNLLVTRTFSKAQSLAGFRVGYAILPESIADDINKNNDAYPLARPSEAAAIATLMHENKINERITELRAWTKELAESMHSLGIQTYPTETYFFLADFSPHNAETIAQELGKRGFLLKPLEAPALGDGFMRITTSVPDNNRQFIQVLKELLKK